MISVLLVQTPSPEELPDRNSNTVNSILSEQLRWKVAVQGVKDPNRSYLHLPTHERTIVYGKFTFELDVESLDRIWESKREIGLI